MVEATSFVCAHIMLMVISNYMVHRTIRHLGSIYGRAGLLLACAVIVLGASSFNLVYARSLQEVQRDIERKQQEQATASAHAHDLGEQASGIQGEINVLVEQIASIQAQIDTNTARQNELNKQIEAAQLRLAEQKELLSANVRSIYIEGDISPLEMIASSKNLGDFIDKQEYRDRIKQNIVTTVNEIESLKKQLDQQKQEVAVIIAEQQTLKQGLDAKNAEAGSRLAAVNQTKAGFDAQVKARQGDIAALQKEVADMQAALARVNVRNLPSSGWVGQGAVIGTVGTTGNSTGNHLHLRAQWGRGGPHNPLEHINSGRWITPTTGRITQYFGSNPWKYGYGASGHDGVDYGAPAGTAIKAVEAGTLYKGWGSALLGRGGTPFGCMAMVEHSDGLISIYAHMQASNC